MVEQPYVAIVQRVSDGEVRRIDGGQPWSDGTYSFWDVGNYSCDCNRYLEFERAGGNDPDMDDPNCACSDGKYRVIAFELSDGTRIDGPDA